MPRANAKNKKIKRQSDKPILHVNALTVRLDLPASLTRKIRLLARAARMINMIRMMMPLINIAILLLFERSPRLNHCIM